MSYHVSLPKKIIFDTKMRDVDLRTYAVIAEACNEIGYSEVTNIKLMKLTGKKKRTLQESLTALENGGYIVVLHNVKAGEHYPVNLPRVIWLEEAHASIKQKKRDEKRKTKENDFRMFVAWLKADCTGILFPVELGGLVHKYTIKGDGFMYRIETGEGPTLMSSEESLEVYKKMFRKKSVIIKHLEAHGESNAVQHLAELANSKKTDYDA